MGTKIVHIVSKEGACWMEEGTTDQVHEDMLELTGEVRQEVLGFGGCFNEIGWEALCSLTDQKRSEILDELFRPEGLHFNSGRIPIGANDYSLEWYSCDEAPEDYALEHFTIERDKRHTLPFVKEALKRQDDFHLFASPWSPPSWMKTKRVYNYGTLRWEKRIREAYAQYLLRFTEEYAKEGVRIDQIHIQNEPVSDQKFPSCCWTGEELRNFIREDIGPVFAESGTDTQLWLGTINGPFTDVLMDGGSPFTEYYDQLVNTVLADKKARNYLSGVGVQWGGKHILEQLDISYPQMHIMQTENECGNGENTWEYAEYVYQLIRQYFSHRTERYLYWNMILPEGGISTWGWKQNSMLTINCETKEVTYQPEFYVMKHISHFVQKGARMLGVKGIWAGNAMVFRNPDGTLVVLVGSSMNTERGFTFKHGELTVSARIAPHSIHTFVIG